MQTGAAAQRSVHIILLRYLYIIVRFISWEGVNERLIVRTACNETHCLWEVSCPQSECSRTLKQIRHFTAVENWDVVLNVFVKLRYVHTNIHPYIQYIYNMYNIYIQYLASINLHYSHIPDRLNKLRISVINTEPVRNFEYENKTQ